MKWLCGLAIVIMVVSAGLHGQVSFEASVDKLHSAYEEPIRLELTVRVTDPNISTRPIMPPNIAGFAIGGSGSSVARSGDTLVRTYTYLLAAERSGRIVIPALELEYADTAVADTLVSEPITVSIDEPLPPTSASSFPDWLLVVCLVVVVAGAVWWYRRTTRVEQPTGEDWRDEKRQQLDEVKRLAEREDYRQFSIDAMKLAVNLLEIKADTRLGGFTTDNLLGFLEERGYDEAQVAQFRELFGFCESAKFSSGAIDRQTGRAAAARLEKIVELLLE